MVLPLLTHRGLSVGWALLPIAVRLTEKTADPEPLNILRTVSV